MNAGSLLAKSAATAVLAVLLLVSSATAQQTGVPQGSADGTWAPISGARAAVTGGTGVWTGTELLAWDGEAGGTYNTASKTWRPISTAGAPHTRAPVVWTGTEMIFWRSGSSAGAAYNPSTDTWSAIPINGAPTERVLETVAWTGSELLVWGGCCTPLGPLGDGARYNPSANVWRPVNTVGAPSPRERHVAVWTGNELLVWGGSGSRGEPFLRDGARYDPSTDTWTPLAPSPLLGGGDYAAVWTGSVVVVWGRPSGCRTDTTDAPCYDGARYNPGRNVWMPISYANVPNGRYHAALVWTGREMLLWGGDTGNVFFGDGGRYDPTTDSWSPVAIAGAPSPRSGMMAAWTGTDLLIWGGNISCAAPSGQCTAADGGRYFPPGSAAPSPPAAPAMLHDERYFPQTGYRIEDDAIWDYFMRRGGLEVFGYPASRSLEFLGCPAQIFQREIAQHCAGEGVQLMNLLDPDLFPYARVGGSTFPITDPNLKAATPQAGQGDYAAAMLEFVQAHAPDEWNGLPVNFGSTFSSLVTPEIAGTDDPTLLGLLNLEIWGTPISEPAVDPQNPNFVYQRFQRGIMHYDARTGITRGFLLADYLKSILRNAADLPLDLREQAGDSRFYRQYCPGASGWLCRSAEVPGTDLTDGFEPG